MSKSRKSSRLSAVTEDMAMYIAMVVRNAMEDFHCRHLSDEQMKELNPIIRNAIGTALHAVKQHGTSMGAQAFVDFHTRLVPKYWERPVLLNDFLEMEAKVASHSTITARQAAP